MRRHPIFDENFFALVFLVIITFLFALSYGHASVPPRGTAVRIKSLPSRKDVRIIKLGHGTIAPIHVAPGKSTILSFPTKPSKVILGSQGLFAIEYVESDVAISSLSARGRSNIFVYMEGRRYAFDLITVPEGGDSIVTVLDDLDEKGRLK